MKDLSATIPAMIIYVQAIFITIFPLGAVALGEDCTDFEGKAVSHGMTYVPGPSVCNLCVCYHMEPKWCQAMFCSPPFSCKKFRIGRRCCEFQCLDEVDNGYWSGSDVVIVNGSARLEKHSVLWMLGLVIVIVIF
ncbi:integral membrane protein DGCR2/IDD-like isoform X1 [Bombus affinis]|uniref:integral membrane protein DGCR2/IDD-like isoform X1 n=1 Tax=Bombus affinis TaxID=309941 RepID=UPI0021B71E8D|nr:integral membrane protein DGCR2/IDD-like isoform X1 [Bombus affinis]XP_050575700.1 integral membrane protein DGCR2/IDD-like isoform X1 [Bombus affinis]XP_050575701.1 integral membrane protein DGCR2/IDD-like isoform X1 [Bombus affinis]XP_050575702.1 integral membrane protein DGCR2/IDD-like isoform X2 [Bombus affinis]XP_050575703.1 integral membrane protein DGCR2/IDD-like isoform X1 [Bombus affinis]XP_050575706.1 integral membrane protein DGCR2/IDD-like isoform X1 [Bombus affinis]XP_05057570